MPGWPPRQAGKCGLPASSKSPTAIGDLIIRLALVACTILATSACRSEAKPAPSAIVWRPLASWSGRGSSQTDTFTSDTGGFRVKWETRNENPAGTGVFDLTLHSAISGRLVAPVVEQRGIGHDVTYVYEDPHVFYFVVSSANLDWTFAVDEGVTARMTRRPDK